MNTKVNSNDNPEQNEDPLAEFAVEPDEGQPQELSDPDDADIPEKYRGKSVKELVSILQEQERWNGKQSNEVGELRKLIDEVILAQDSKDTPAQNESNDEIGEMDWYTDPQSVVEKVVKKTLAADPKFNAAVDGVTSLTRKEVVEKLMEKHPDAAEITQSPQFHAWVKQSPVRIQLFNQASQYDFDSADELYTMYKVVHGSPEKSAKPQTPSVKDASTGDTRGRASSAGKVYRREDIVKLMKKDYPRYKQLLPEIEKAYREGRVR